MLVALGLAVASIACVSSAPAQTQAALIMTAHEHKAAQVVRRYVAETHKWRRTEYSVELRRRDEDVLEFWILHDDETFWLWQSMGGGKSISVHVDSKSLRVLRGLGFQ